MTTATAQRRASPWLETGAVFVAVSIFYWALLSSLPVDDAPRYVAELGANRFFWDIGHVWIQPLALLIHRLISSWSSPLQTLEGVNIVTVALGCAIFFDTLRCLGHSLRRSLAAVALVAVSCNLLSLVPTAHIKPMVFLPLALLLRHGTFWERDLAATGKASTGHALMAGLWLGVGGNLLVSIVPMGVYIGVFMALRAWQRNRRWLAAIRAALPFAVAALLAGFGFLVLAYVVEQATGAPQSLKTFILGGLEAKESLRDWGFSWREVPLRTGFSIANNFAFLPNIGGLARAAMWGYVSPGSAAFGTLVREAAMLLLSLGAIATIIILALRRQLLPQNGQLLALGQLCGAATFSIYYNLNDPEHWFQFTLPLVFLAVQLRIRRLDVLVLAVWLPLLAINNLGLYSVPRALYDKAQGDRALQEALGPKGLYVGYAAYPGEPDSSLLDRGGIESFNIDQALAGTAGGKAADVMLAGLQDRIDRTLDRGGKVLVFRALDDADWRGPMLIVQQAGAGNAVVGRALRQRYRVDGPIQVAGFPAYSLSRREGP